MPRHICITGASGFLGSHIVEQLLRHGCAVDALLRRPTAHLQRLAARHEHLRLHVVDLAQPGACNALFSDCDTVIHCAASVTNNARPGSRQWHETLKMNVNGTQNVIEGIRQSARVHTFVYTSSMAAILSPGMPADHVFSEVDWNHASLEASDPYWYSKTAAERLVTDAFQPWPCEPRVVCINPSVIIGPVLDPRHAATSIAIINDLHTGKTPACPDLNFHFVDVRDLAELHVRAALDKVIEGRFIVPGHEASMLELAAMIKRRFPDSKAPQRRAPDWLMYVSALFNPRLSRRYLQQNLGVRRAFDDRRTRRTFQLGYRPLEHSIADTLESLSTSSP
ncbi:NAD-dependent epimerase/dehydratase family protein [Pseudomonas orientalis]|uniref:NAD-dependent epimerase/dehydratase family protein n=1 Tax=Pseudomonas orientalis TaxID=76758 RepID=UPI0015E76C52|nr:NAD-dependent epimerase/dehydratase family protein [Pseudomonas orientalis]MBA1429398.1 NAD-dependent epimerase/dehydratase family protein [Pseudomonas orientalis]